MVDQAFVIDGNNQAGRGNGIVGNLDGGRDDALQIACEAIEGVAVQTIGKYDKLYAARAEHTASAAGEREHTTSIFGEHSVNGVSPIVLIELRRTANAHGDQARLMVIATAAVDGVDQHALGAESRGGIDRFNEGVVNEFADIKRGRISVSVDAIAPNATKHVIAFGVAYAILHNAIAFRAIKDLVDVLGICFEVIGVHACLPVIAAVIDVLRGKSKIAQRSLRPERAVLIKVFDKEVASLIEHREGVKNAVINLKVICVDLTDVAAIEMYGIAQLVVIHAMVGVLRHAVLGFAQFGIGMRHAIAKRMGHLGVVVFEEHRAAMLQALGKVILGRDGGEHGKLVATQAKRRLANLDVELKVQAHLHDVAVTLVVPKDIVAVLKVIDIDKRHSDRRALPPDLFERLGKTATVAKTGELVGKGGPNQIILTLEKVTDGLFERFGVIADSIHVLSGFLRSGRIASGELVVYTRRCSAHCVYPGLRLAALLGYFAG